MEIVGKIDYLNNIKINPLELNFSQFTEPRCDECGTNHNRLYTYVVQLDNGNLIQVGRGCINKLFPKTYNYEVLDYNEVDLLKYLFTGFSKKRMDYETRELLYMLIQYNRKYGFDNKNFNLVFNDKQFLRELGDPDLWDYSLVDAIIEWYENNNVYGDFQENVKSLVLNEYMPIRYINIFKYAYKIYNDAVNYVPQQRSKVTTYTETTIREVELSNSHNYRYYGNDVSTNVYRIIDVKGNVFEYETSREIDFQPGDKIRFKYKENKYLKQNNPLNQSTNINYVSKKYGVVNKIKNVKVI